MPLFQNSGEWLITTPLGCFPLAPVVRLSHLEPKGVWVIFLPSFFFLSLELSAASLEKHHLLSLEGVTFSHWNVLVGWMSPFEGGEKSFGRLIIPKNICLSYRSWIGPADRLPVGSRRDGSLRAGSTPPLLSFPSATFSETWWKLSACFLNVWLVPSFLILKITPFAGCSVNWDNGYHIANKKSKGPVRVAH